MGLLKFFLKIGPKFTRKLLRVSYFGSKISQIQGYNKRQSFVSICTLFSFSGPLSE